MSNANQSRGNSIVKAVLAPMLAIRDVSKSSKDGTEVATSTQYRKLVSTTWQFTATQSSRMRNRIVLGYNKHRSVAIQQSVTAKVTAESEVPKRSKSSSRNSSSNRSTHISNNCSTRMAGRLLIIFLLAGSAHTPTDWSCLSLTGLGGWWFSSKLLEACTTITDWSWTGRL